MRIDLYLKNSRLIRRRKIANEACMKGLVLINDVIVKPSSKVKVLDIVTLNLGSKQIVVEVTNLEVLRNELMYKLISEKYTNKDKA